MKKIMAVIVATFMVFCNLQMPVKALESETKEDATVSVYPTPQSVDFHSKEGMKLEGTVDLVIHNEQNTATMTRLKKLLQDEGISFSEKNEIGENAAIVLAIKEHDDCQICSSVSDKAGALKEEQGYVLESSDDTHKKGQITIVGTDSDGVYYGVMTLLQMFEQKTSDGRIAEVTISDYPDVKYRGYVEGFYGIPWSYDDRANLFKDTTKYKMNTYIYAPKDDPYHRGSWRTLYPEDKAQEIKGLAQIAVDNNMTFCWTIHPGADYNYTKDSDGDGVVDDYAALIAKFEQVYSLGVRQFGIFYDDLDYGVANGEQHATVINNAYTYLKSKYNDVKPFITVLTRYTNSWGASMSGYFTPFMKKINEDTIVLWTGNSTMSAVTRDYFEWPQTQTGVDRDFGVWWNYPVNDYSHGNLFMEPLDCLDNDVDNICSFFLNPMSEADASKVAIYSGADYSWNISDFKSKESWSRAIDELVPEADEEFERFANNIGYLNQGSGFFFDESTYLKDDIDALNNALSSGKGLDQAVKQLKDRFVQMEQDVQILRTIKNKELLEEITSHLNAYEAIAKAGIAAMDAFNDASNGDIESCMSHLEVLEAKLAESQSYKVTLLGGGTTQAKVCTYRIFPLLDNCSGQIMTILNKNINSTVQERMLSNVDGLKLQDVQYQSSTYSIKDISVTMNKNDYLGIALPKVVNIYQIKVKGTPLDHFKVQYSLNGIEWKDIDAQEKDDTLTTNNIVTAAYARILCTKDGTKAEIDQLSVMPAYDPVSASITTDMTTYQNYIISNAMDGDLSTKYWSSSNVADGNHICVDLGALSTLKTVEIYSGINRLGTVDCFPKTRLEISKDGKTWEQVDSTKDVSEFSKVDGEDSLMKLSFDAKGSQARYFRLICEGNGDVWVMVNEIIYDSEYADYENHLKVDTNMPIYHTYKKENAFDGNKSTWMWTSRGSQKDDYVKVDLGNLVPLYDASIYFGKNTENASLVIDGFHSTKCQVSTDGETWKDAGTLSFDEYEENGDYYIANFNSDGTLVRYIRFVSLENYDSWVKVYEVTYNQTIEAMKNTSKTVSTNMSKYSDYDIQYALDDDMDTRFYSNSSTKAGDYVQVDFGKIISVYDAAIYFGGSPNSEATAIDGFGKTKVQVSKDGQTWSDVGGAKANTEYTLVNGRYLASFNVGGVSARYLRFTATEACKNWAQIYEMQFNKSVDDNAIRYTSGNVNINHSNYLDDGQLQTSPVIYQVSNGDQLIYPMTTITNVKTIGILQDAQAISNAQVSIQKLDGQWIEIGQLDKLWNKFEINDKILAIRMTFDGQKQPMINEIIVTPMDSDELISYIDELENGDYSSYTEESVKALKDEIEKAKKVANDTNSTQKDINDALESLKKAKDALVLKEADYTKVDKAIKKANALNKDDYKDFSAVEKAIANVQRGLDITKQEEVDSYAKAIEEAIAKLALKDADYTKVDEAIKKANALNKDDYKDFSAVEKAIANVKEGLDFTRQEEVDSYAKAIEEAISKLELKDQPGMIEDENNKKEETEKTEEKENEATKTGDDTNVIIYVVAFVLAIALGGFLFVKRKKK